MGDAMEDEGWEVCPEVLITMKRLGITQVEEMDVSKLYAQPPPPASGTVEQAVARALSGEPSEAIIALQAEVDKLTAATESARMLGEKDELYLLSKKRKDAATEKLKGLTGKTPTVCSKSTAMKLALAKQEWQDSLKTAADGRAKGKEKAVAKNSLDLCTIDGQILRLQALRTSLVSTFAKTEAAFKDAQAAREEWVEKIAEGIDTKIALATPIGGTAEVELGAAEAGGAGAEQAGAVPFDFSDLTLRTNAQPEDLPTLVLAEISTEYKATLDSMWTFMSANPEGAPLPPVTYEQIGAKHVGAVLALLGQTVWHGLYQTQMVVHTRLVPWQVLMLIRYALKKFAKELVTDKAMSEKIDSILDDARKSARVNQYTPY